MMTLKPSPKQIIWTEQSWMGRLESTVCVYVSVCLKNKQPRGYARSSWEIGQMCLTWDRDFLLTSFCLLNLQISYFYCSVTSGNSDIAVNLLQVCLTSDKQSIDLQPNLFWWQEFRTEDIRVMEHNIVVLKLYLPFS